MKFRKYHGCGNDFLIGEYCEGFDYQMIAKKICNRNIGIGADGMILNKKEREMIFYNADGSRALMCGNGIRCFANYLLDKNEVQDDEFIIKTAAGLRKVKVLKKEENNKEFIVNLGMPNYDLKISSKRIIDKDIYYKDKVYNVTALNMNANHLVVFVHDFSEVTEELGSTLSNPPFLSEAINVNFVIPHFDYLEMITYERGVGFTKACGTGASASFFVAKSKNLCGEEVLIRQEYGTLHIKSIDGEIYMQGPAVFIGEVDVVI